MSRGPDWLAANPVKIAAMAARAATRPTGGWVVAGPTPKRGCVRRAQLPDGPVVVWHDREGVVAGPDVCPHMGAELSRGGRVDASCLVCPWHDLKLDRAGHGWWKPLPTFDDGTLTWVRRPTEVPTDTPIIPKRPDAAVSVVVERVGRCEVRDIVENRLDPWHGRYLHPYAFADLVVVDEDESGVTVDVGYRIAPRIVTTVRARFDAPEAATVRMLILDGTGTGSVVESHATQIAPDRCRLTEASFATSPGHDLSKEKWARGLAWFLGRSAARLWRDDMAYAERRYALRHREVPGWRG